MSQEKELEERDQPKPLGQHLNDLRKAIIYPLMVWGLTMILGLIFQEQTLNAFLWPVRLGMRWAEQDDPSLAMKNPFRASARAQHRLFVPTDDAVYVVSRHGLHRVSPSGERVWGFDLKGKEIFTSLSPDAKRLAVFSTEDGLILLDADSGKSLWTKPELKDIEELRFSPNAERLVVSRMNGEIVGYGMDGREQFRELFPPPEIVPPTLNLGPMDVFLVIMKAALIVGLIPGIPFFVFSLWKFIKPGLYPHEQAILRPVLWAISGLFFAGAAFAYFLVVPIISMFLYQLNAKWTVVLWDITKFMDLTLVIMLAFGIVFELPLVIVLLTQLNIVTPDGLVKHRRIIWLGTFILAAFLTPPDPFSQSLLALPTILLFEAGVVVSRWLLRKREEKGAQAG